MLNQIKAWLQPKSLRVANDKHRLERLLRESGMSRSVALRVVATYFKTASKEIK